MPRLMFISAVLVCMLSSNPDGGTVSAQTTSNQSGGKMGNETGKQHQDLSGKKAHTYEGVVGGVSISDDGAVLPDASAILDVSVTGSSKKGVLIPRMTEGEREGIASPATGLLVYQTDGSAGFYYYNGSTWTQLAGGGAGETLYLPLSGGTMTGPITSTGSPTITMGKGNFGTGNLNPGTGAFVAGTNNRASGDYSVVSGGGGPFAVDSNTASGDYSTAGGGQRNTATNMYSTVAGGFANTATGFSATVSGGGGNTATDGYATVGGGISNASSNLATVAGGTSNVASGLGGAIGGGRGNKAVGTSSTVAGGSRNSASGMFSVVSGGGGDPGDANLATGDHSSIGGGKANIASGSAAAVGGGSFNSASAGNATVAGGISNTSSNAGAAVGGGSFNTAVSIYATIGGGSRNRASGNYTTIGGGYSDTASGNGGTIGGGWYNKARGAFSVVSGGGGLVETDSNSAVGDYSTVPGGRGNRAKGEYSLAAGRRAKADHAGTFVWADATDADFASLVSNTFLIRASNGVGIGTALPASPLHIQTPAEVNCAVRLMSGLSWPLILNQSPGSIFTITNGGSQRFAILPNGRIGIGTTAPDQLFSVNGDASKIGGGTWSTFSDRRLKREIQPFADGLEIIRRINPVMFRYNGKLGLPEGKSYVGVVAQEIQDVAPYTVDAFSGKLNQEDSEETEILRFDANALTFVAINALKELDRRLAEVEQLRSENQMLHLRVSRLEEMLESIASDARQSGVLKFLAKQ